MVNDFLVSSNYKGFPIYTKDVAEEVITNEVKSGSNHFNIPAQLSFFEKLIFWEFGSLEERAYGTIYRGSGNLAKFAVIDQCLLNKNIKEDYLSIEVSYYRKPFNISSSEK